MTRTPAPGGSLEARVRARIEEGRTTALEGYREKIFLDRYALKDKEGKPLEKHPEEMWLRVAEAIASVEPEDRRDEWAEKFYDVLSDFRFVPGGRILSGAGTGFDVTYYNCFSYETPVHTDKGIVPIGSLRGEHLVLSEGGVFRPAYFDSYGRQRLWEVTLSNGAVLHATPNHSWVVTTPKGGTERVTTMELEGRRIPVNPRPKPPKECDDYRTGVRHGVVFGDGTTQYGKAHLDLFGPSQELSGLFSEHAKLGLVREVPASAALAEHTRVSRLPVAYKALPDPTSVSPSYIRGFVSGLIASDGHVDRRGHVMIHNKDADVLARVADMMAHAGFVGSGVKLARQYSPFDGSEKPLYKLTILKASVEPDDLLRSDHRANFEGSPRARVATLEVVSVHETDRLEEVYCCVESETHTITVGHGYLTGQCFVIPSPEDSVEGIFENITMAANIMRRSGGVGVNLSSLRPRGAYIKTVNGTSSGPCSWAILYSDMTGKVIIQGGSRRGALMIMLDDDHPDIEEFVEYKRKNPGHIDHANLSVAVSDAFMQAVKEDKPWDLKWQGKVWKTIRARDLWHKIAESAHAYAEPGVVFMDRYNKESNTWYFENIRCVNPCGEQGLPPFGVCNLGALNLLSFVKERDGERYFDFEELDRATRVSIRFLDDVIDATNYPFEENRQAQQQGTRRTGLGTMGIADVLIKLGIRYGSDEALPVVERIYQTIRDAAYDMSADIAAEKGPFPKFDREKYLQGRFIQRLPKEVQDKIREHGIRNGVLLTQAPTGTTSSLAGVNSGIEPVFAFVTKRTDRLGEHVLYHPLAQEWRDEHPDEPLPDYFVSSGDLTPEEHVRMQAVVQKYTDSSISKTVNGPATDTVEFVEQLYLDAYDLGCKGITYYRQGSRDAVLEAVTEQAAEKVAEKVKELEGVPAVRPMDATIRERPNVMHGYTRQIRAPEGKVLITVNSDEKGPVEVFITLGKAGSDIAAMAEALGRLISLSLRMPSPMTQDERIWEIADQLRNIGGSRSVGFGAGQVKSLPDAVGQALIMHLRNNGDPRENGHTDLGSEPEATPQDIPSAEYTEETGGSLSGVSSLPIQKLLEKTVELTGNLCPACGCNSLVAQEGCRKCVVCGHSEC